jgi:hypothetical protein
LGLEAQAELLGRLLILTVLKVPILYLAQLLQPAEDLVVVP